MATPTRGPSRTIWIWILILAAVIIGILDLIDAARYMGWLPIAQLGGELNFVLPSAYWLGAMLSVIVAAIWFWVAKQLYNLDPRGWLFVVVIAVINLIFLGMSLLGDNTFSDILWAGAVNVVALIIGVLPSTKAAFEQ